MTINTVLGAEFDVHLSYDKYQPILASVFVAATQTGPVILMIGGLRSTFQVVVRVPSGHR